MFLAPGICPARCAVSVIPGGAMISPTNSGVDRTSTSAVFFALRAFSTSGRLARIAAFTFLGTGYVVARTLERSLTSGRPSATHFARPPFISFALACPYSCSSQKANAANQLLLSPYSTTVVLGVTPAFDKSSANACLSGMSRRTGSFSCDCQFQPTAPAMCPESYAVVSTSTSIKRMPGSVRCPATHSLATRTSGCAYATLASNQVKPDSASRVSGKKNSWDGGTRSRPLPRPLREVYGDDQPVFGPGGDAHGSQYARTTSGIQCHGGSGEQGAVNTAAAGGTALLPAPCSLLPTAGRKSEGSPRLQLAPRTRFPRSYAAATAGANSGST